MTDGWTVPGFTVLRELGPTRGPADRDGRTASGPVVLAVDDVTQTQVAIKYLPVGTRHDLAVIRRLGRVEDPNVVEVYDVVEDPYGPAAIIMELVDGGVGLDRILATQGPTGPLAALAVLSGTLLGLAAAHQAGVLHGNYRPGGLLIGKDGVGKLVGFGLGVPSGDGAVGELAYLAPEQWTGAPLDQAADLYSATAVFFECLTGHSPYRGSKPGELARAHRTAPIPVEEVPGPLQTLIARGLAKDPAQRPASAAEFVGELEDAAVAAYGLAWESQGRGRAAEMAVRAATAPDPVPTGRHARADSGLTDQPPREAGSRREARARREASTLHWDGPGRVDESWRMGAPGQAEEPWSPAEPGRTDGSRYAGAAGGTEEFWRAGELPRADDRRRTDPVFAPPGEQAPLITFEPVAPAARPAGSRRRMLIGVGVVVALALAGVGFAVLNGGGGGSRAAVNDRPQSTPTPADSPTDAPSNAGATALAALIATAVDRWQTATFIYHGPGGAGGVADTIDATGVFRADSTTPAAYDLTVWNPGDKRLSKHLRTVLIGDAGYVSAGGWKQAPATRATAKDDIPHAYAAMAATIRWAGSPPGLLAVLRAATDLTQSAGVYTGAASLRALAADPAAAPLWSAYDDAHYQLSYVLRLGPDDLPRALDVLLEPRDSASPAAKAPSLDFRTTYAHWGRKTVINPPA